MDYLTNQAGSITAKAMGHIAKLKSKRQQEEDRNQTVERPEEAQQQPGSSQKVAPPALPTATPPRPVANVSRPTSGYYRRSGAFGGDSDTIEPPPIGFKSAFLPGVGPEAPVADLMSGMQGKAPGDLPQPGNFVLGHERAIAKRYENLSGGFWSGSYFQRLLILTVLRLCLFIRKVYEDYSATLSYQTSLKSHWHTYVLSLATFILPTLIFTLYRLCRYLQTVVFVPEEELLMIEAPRSATMGMEQHHRGDAPIPLGIIAPLDEVDRRLAPSTNQEIQGDDKDDQDGLVTARQSPINDSFLQDTGSPSPAPTIPLTGTRSVSDIKSSSSALMPVPNREPLMSAVSVEDLEIIPDKETVSMLMGSLSEIVHGVMFIFWQLKRQVDIVSFLVIRCCFWREPRQLELLALNSLSSSSDGLEFFEDFYAGFLGILIQVAQLASTISPYGNMVNSNNVTITTMTTTPKPIEDIINSTATTSLASAKSSNSGSSDLVIMSELIVSLFVVWSLLIAVRRRDDGILSFVLSTIGWGSIFASRIIIIAMSILYFHYWLILLLALHVAFISYWIYLIALRSHNGLENEERVWLRSDEDDVEDPQDDQEDPGDEEVEAADTGESKDEKRDENEKEIEKEEEPTTKTVPNTASWSIFQHVALLSQIVSLFGLPSLFYWPFMFNLKLAYRPFIYMTIIMAENFLLILTLYFGLTNDKRPDGHLYFLAMVAVTSITGFVFLSCYIACKPRLTDQFARYDMVVNEAQTSGIYYEFCSRVFRLPDVTHSDFRRLTYQKEVQEEASDC